MTLAEALADDLGSHVESVEVLIVGTGFAGLGMAERLYRSGFRDITIIEKANDVGGTWRDNTYPGAACDVPSHLYSFSFEPNPRWSRSFSVQAEILDYLRHCAERYGIRPAIRFSHEMLSADWDSQARRWLVKTTGGTFAARYLIAGMGPLAEPSIPDVPGLADFEGPVWHSARWNHDEALAGKTVAVIGSGASSIQFLPEIAPTARRVILMQRTPPWVMPRRDRAIGEWEKRLFRRLPRAQLAARAGIYWGRELFFLGFKGNRSRRKGMGRVEKVARTHLADQIANPALRERLTPDYAIGCKRILLSNDWYPALGRENVEVVDGGLTEIRARGVVGPDGVEHPADVIIFGTGFHATDPPVASLIRGHDGELLAKRWVNGMAAYKGTAIAGFPNFFMLVGPNTGLGHNSIVYIVESQTSYVAQALEHLRSSGQTMIDVRPDVEERWNEEVQRQMASTVWSTGGCASWYLDGNGRNTTLWPGFSFQYRAAVRHFDPEAYQMTHSPAPVPSGVELS